MKRPSPTGAMRVPGVLCVCLIVLCLLWIACADNAESTPQPEDQPRAQGIPAHEFDAFANLIQNIDLAQIELDEAQAVGNPATIREKGVMLAQQQQILTHLYIDKHGRQMIDQWVQTVRAASSSTSAGRERPPSMKELRQLFAGLGAHIITDENDNITSLDCKNINLPDDALKHLSQLKHLRVLSLSATEITDDDLAQLKSLKLLRSLNLSRNKLTGPGLRHLTDLDNLEMLYLNGTGLTDIALPDLEAIDHLKKITLLNLESTALTTKGYARVTRLFRRADVRF